MELLVLALVGMLSPAVTVFILLKYLPARAESREMALRSQAMEGRRLDLEEKRAAIDLQVLELKVRQAEAETDLRVHRMQALKDHPNGTNPHR